MIYSPGKGKKKCMIQTIALAELVTPNDITHLSRIKLRDFY